MASTATMGRRRSQTAAGCSCSCSRPTTSKFVQYGVDWRRVNAELAQPGKLRRRDVVVLHQRDLIACQGSSRHIFGNRGQHMPHRKRHRDEAPPGAEVSGDRAEKFLVRVDLWTTKFVAGPRHTRGVLHQLRDSLGDILDVDRLQLRLTTADQGANREESN